ncbi:MAG: SO_0444 family Cu/Zn efflux transporter [Amphritea sp.]
MFIEFLNHLLNLFLDTAIWLLFGLILAAILKGWIPSALVQRWLSGTGIGSVIRAAFIGAPLPLCSCGVLPTAIGLRRSGASKPATVAFLVATPETGVDSISVTYALLGPVMAIIRPLAALTSAIVSGLMVLFLDQETQSAQATMPATTSCCASKSTTKPADESSCCSAKTAQPPTQANDCPTATTKSVSCSKNEVKQPPSQAFMAGLHFAIVDILDDISKWLAFGLVLAAVIATLIEPASLSEWGSGLSAMLLMLAAGLPLYICATASTPLAAAFLAAGMSPGAVLVFLLVGPATNIASIGILSRELGIRALVLYLTGISVSAVILGLTTDAFLSNQALTLGQASIHQNTAFQLAQWIAAAILLILAIKPIRQIIWPAKAAEIA